MACTDPVTLNFKKNNYFSTVLKVSLGLIAIQLVLGLALINLRPDASVSSEILDSLPISPSLKNSPNVVLARRELVNAAENARIIGWGTSIAMVLNIGLSIKLFVGSILERRKSRESGAAE
jgi:hypothetical protein